MDYRQGGAFLRHPGCDQVFRIRFPDAVEHPGKVEKIGSGEEGLGLSDAEISKEFRLRTLAP